MHACKIATITFDTKFGDGQLYITFSSMTEAASNGQINQAWSENCFANLDHNKAREAQVYTGHFCREMQYRFNGKLTADYRDDCAPLSPGTGPFCQHASVHASAGDVPSSSAHLHCQQHLAAAAAAPD